MADDDPSGIAAFVFTSLKFGTIAVLVGVTAWIALRIVWAVISWAFWL